LSMKSKACLFQMMLVIFLMSSSDALEWYSMGDFVLVTFILIT
jgi:hypothetical protein